MNSHRLPRGSRTVSVCIPPVTLTHEDEKRSISHELDKITTQGIDTRPMYDRISSCSFMFGTLNSSDGVFTKQQLDLNISDIGFRETYV